MTPPYSSYVKPLQTPDSPIIFEPKPEKFTPALKDCVELTGDGIEIMKPKYSPLWWGIKGAFAEQHGDYLRGLPNAMGFLVLAACPVLIPARYAIGGIGVVAGATSTAVVAPLAGVEKVYRKLSHADALNDPALKRDKLMEAFTKRMRRMITASVRLTELQKKELMQQPQQLIALSALALAFNSKEQFSDKLVMADNAVLEKQQIESLDSGFKHHFEEICQLKNSISRIGSFESDFTWKKLMECLDDPSKTTALSKEEQVKRYVELGEQAFKLAEDIFDDEGFQKTWTVDKALIERTL